MKRFIYKKITQKDREKLSDILNRNGRYSDEWWVLDAYWKKRYRYSLRVQLIFDFIGKLIVPSGKGAGKPFVLRNFEKDFIRDIYDPITKNNKRLVRRAILSLARKNGKTTLIACLVLVHLVGPENIMNGENYSLANDRDQASIVFKYAAQIVRADPELEQYIRIVDSTKTMVCYSNGSTYRALSAEVSTKFGLNTSFAVFDELAQARNRDLYDSVDTSMAAREEPLFVVISTQSSDPQHILSQLIDDGISGHDTTTVCHLYAVPDDADDSACFSDKKLWKLANPALGDFRSLSEMKTAAKRAVRMPTFEASFRNLYLNQRIDAQSPFIPRIEWMGCKGDVSITHDEGLYLGLDLSGKTDLTALVGVSDGEKEKVKAWFWKPKESLQEHENRDRVPYIVWEKQKYILTTPGRAIQYKFIAHELAGIVSYNKIIGMAFDRYRIDDLMNAMTDIGLECYVDGKDEPRAGALRLVPWGQGYKDMTPAVEALEISILQRRLVHDGNPVLTWNISNAIAISDPAGNKKLDKSKTRFRIDGAVALSMAVGLKSRDMLKEPEPSVYNNLSKEQILERLTI
jgi:phage terminase large subunit-like protein